MTAQAYPIEMPRLNSNDDVAMLGNWLIADGDSVEKGRGLFTAETTKSISEVAAVRDGYVYHHVPGGSEVTVGQTVGWISTVPSRPQMQSPSKPAADSVAVDITRKARQLAEELGVDIAAIGKKGVIRQKDVQAFYDARVRQAPLSTEPDAATETLATQQASIGKLDGEFLRQIRADAEHFAQLDSALKIWLYRRHGAQIGQGVTMGRGTMIDAESVSIGDHTTLDENVLIRCRTFVMGSLCEIGYDSKVLCQDFITGNVVVIRFRAVFVGSTKFACRIGDNTFIAYDTYVNTDRDVTIGCHSCLSPGAKIFTHRKWQSPLDGYSTAFMPVCIGDHCHLGPSVVVLPGVEMGDRVTVMPNSVVSVNVDPDQLIGGIPAQPVVEQRLYHRPLDAAQKTRAALKVLADCVASLTANGIGIDQVSRSDQEFRFELTHHGDVGHVCFFASSAPGPEPDRRCLLLSFDPAVLNHASADTTVFDLSNYVVKGRRDGLSDLLRKQLAHLGVEFSDMLWRPDAPVGSIPETY